MKPHWAGRKQIAITIYCGILFLLCACVNSGMTNTVLPQMCELRGWHYTDALPFMSYGGYIGAGATLCFAQLVVKRNAKFVIVLGLILGGLSITVYGITRSFLIFSLCIIGNRVFSCAYQQAGTPALLNTWFPKTKGIVLGWATMGIILSDVIWSPYIPKALDMLGAPVTMGAVGVIFLILALLTLRFVKNTPEEAGTYPDNNSDSLDKSDEDQAALREHGAALTWQRLLRMPQAWQIGIGWGLLWMLTMVFISQIVNRCQSIGYDTSSAILLLQTSSIVGLAGSWAFGFLDQKLGTKRATMCFAVCIMSMFILALFQRHSTVILWISTFGVMACGGGIANLTPSMVGTVFGRWNFAAANRLISPLVMMISSSAYLIVSVCIKTGIGYVGMDVLCIILAVICLVIIYLTKDARVVIAD